MAFYGAFALLSVALGVLLGTPVIAQYLQTGMVPRMPTMAAAITCGIVGCLAITAGLILDGMRKTRHELSRLVYLQHFCVGAV